MLYKDCVLALYEREGNGAERYLSPHRLDSNPPLATYYLRDIETVI